MNFQYNSSMSPFYCLVLISCDVDVTSLKFESESILQNNMSPEILSQLIKIAQVSCFVLFCLKVKGKCVYLHPLHYSGKCVTIRESNHAGARIVLCTKKLNFVSGNWRMES